MIRAMFEENVRKTEARGLVQWDYGQILQIEGLKGIDHAEVRFAVKECSAKAEICIATIEENRILADIPDKLLEVGKDLIAYVYIADAMSGKTVRIIELPVKKREQPGDYSTPSGKNLLRQVLESLEKKADNMTVIDGELQLLSGDTPVGNRVRMETAAGKEIEIRNDGTSIQWRYTDQNEWKELIPLADLKGEDGKPPEFEIREGHLIVKYE